MLYNRQHIFFQHGLNHVCLGRAVLFTNSTLVLSSSFSPHTLVSSGFIPCWKIYRYIFFFQSSATDNLLETKPPIVASMAVHMVTDEPEDACLVIKIKSIFSYSTIISVWFWPSNPKTKNLHTQLLKPFIFGHRVDLGIVLLTWTPHDGGTHL